jgi:V/A-type H+-transporting ATPase subunit E
MQKGAETIATLVRKIEEEARRRAEELLKEKRSQVKKALEEARKKAEEEKMAALDKAKVKAKLEKDLILRKARSEARWMRLTAREELIERVFRRAEKEFKESIKDKQTYARVLSGLIEEAAVELGGGTLTVSLDARGLEVLSPEVLRRIAKSVKKRVKVLTVLELSRKPINAVGVVVRSKDGSVEVNNTLEARMRRLREVLRPQVARILFSERI